VQIMTRLAIFTSLVIVGCSSPLPQSTVEPTRRSPAKVSEKLKGVLGDKVVAVLAGATKVEPFRIDPNSLGTEDADKTKERIGGYLVIGKGETLDKDSLAELVDVLLDDETYFGIAADCFMPGIVFRIWKGQEDVEVLICFQCDNLQFLEGKITEGSFGGSRSRERLIELAKKAFPKDKRIQALGKPS